MVRVVSYLDFRKFEKEQKIRFFMNVGIGILVAILQVFIKQTNPGENLLNKAFDSVVAKEARKSAAFAAKPTPGRNELVSERIVFVDIDEDTFRNWGFPLVTPRKELARIVKSAADGHAKVIVLDILLEDMDCCHPEGEKELGTVLKGMAGGGSDTKIVFPVRIAHDGTIRKNLFDDLIAGNPNFHYGSPTLAFTFHDRIVRFWHPYETAKSRRGNTVLWNVSFLAAILAEGEKRELVDIREEIESGRFSRPRHIPIGNGREIVLSPDTSDSYTTRIRFTLIPKGALADYPGGNLFTAVSKMDELGRTDFRGKIVIIGNSSPDVGDTHPTPVGSMPGMYILGNAINTILLGKQPSPPPWFMDALIDAFAILMASYLFLHFQSLVANLIISVLLIAVLGPFAYHYFSRTGTFLNFSFCFVGMGFQNTIYSLLKSLEGRRKPNTR